MRNVKIEKINDFVEKCKNDPSLLEKKMVLEVSWNMDDSLPQMVSKISYGESNQEFFVDQADFLGGGGRAPNPIQYCILGLASCFLSTFSIICKKMELNIRSVKVIAKTTLDLSLPLLGVDKDVNKGFEFEIVIDSSESEERIEEAKRLALETCPAVWCLKNPIPVNASLQKVVST